MTVPMLNAAWKRDMIERPMHCSTAAPSTFWETSHWPAPNPTMNNPIATIGVPTRVPMATIASPIAHVTDITIAVRR